MKGSYVWFKVKFFFISDLYMCTLLLEAESVILSLVLTVIGAYMMKQRPRGWHCLSYIVIHTNWNMKSVKAFHHNEKSLL